MFWFVLSNARIIPFFSSSWFFSFLLLLIGGLKQYKLKYSENGFWNLLHPFLLQYNSKVRFKITLLIEIIKRYSVKVEGARFSHLKNISFSVATPFLWDPHHPNVTAFLKILGTFCEPHKLPKQQLKMFNKKDPSSQK